MFPCGDARALATALARVLDDPAVRARLGMAGQARVARFAWPNVTDEVVAVYDEVTASKSVRR
jgi:glycosyltransferase involved in cell wall biosynthesis